ncbi:MAG: diacylglycerol kinase family protein [Dysgonomonas sp.]|nr:diacylglycerol kinase family protein [Dysgonomonas sp.]
MTRNKKNKFSIKERLLSFKYAFNGLRLLFTEEHNSRIHITITIIVVVMGIYFNISISEWLIILLLIALVFCMEIINSAIENLADYISPEWHSKIKKVKDLSAAGVFVAALISVICGLIIFIPKICDFLLPNGD